MGKNKNKRRRPQQQRPLAGPATTISDGTKDGDDPLPTTKNHLDKAAWASILARNQQREAITSGSQTTKAERIEKRHAKKQRRQERREQASACQDSENSNILRSDLKANSSLQRRVERRSFRQLEVLSKKVEERVQASKVVRTWQKPYTPPLLAATGRKRKRLDAYLQPRKSDYGGIGLARPSLWISLSDPSWKPRLEEEFAEHIAGFFGKQRTKAMKKQMNSDMLWRKLQAEKQSSNSGNKKINGKKLSAMTPDERVEEMLKAGML